MHASRVDKLQSSPHPASLISRQQQAVFGFLPLLLIVVGNAVRTSSWTIWADALGWPAPLRHRAHLSSAVRQAEQARTFLDQHPVPDTAVDGPAELFDDAHPDRSGDGRLARNCGRRCLQTTFSQGP